MHKIFASIFSTALVFSSVILFFTRCNAPNLSESSIEKKENIKVKKNTNIVLYTMPSEHETHAATWLQWPHRYQHGTTYSNRLQNTWVQITKALIQSEKVHIIAYNEIEKEKITHLLIRGNVPVNNIEFNIFKTDDVWIRDNGPIYVKDKKGEIFIQDWGFNGWGNKMNFENCNAIPKKISDIQKYPYVNLNDVLINEGGSIEVDGKGTIIACKSSILNKNRNPTITVEKAEKIFSTYLGITNFIWLKGKAGLEITDMHIDGFARFGNGNTIVTMNKNDLLNWDVLEEDIETLYAAKDTDAKAYKIVTLPLTKENVITEYGKNLNYKGSYINYYIANTVVLVPNYNDPHDKIANEKILQLYPTKKVIGVDVRNLYENGGMIHCVTMQQPK